jgi:CheY-like chemotaxis protein
MDIKILFVEDEPTIRSILAMSMKQKSPKSKAFFAEDGVQALKILYEKPKGFFDVIMSDIRMPNMSGIDLYQTVRSYEFYESYKETPFIFFSGSLFEDITGVEDMKRQIDVDQNMHLLGKPAKSLEIIEMIRKAANIPAVAPILDCKPESKGAEAKLSK